MIKCHVLDEVITGATHSDVIRRLDGRAIGHKQRGEMDMYYRYDQASEYMRRDKNETMDKRR